MPRKEPSRTKLKNAAIAAKTAALPKIAKEVLDQIVAEGPRPHRPSWRPSSKAAGAANSPRRGGLAPRLGPRHSVLRLPAGAIESINARLRKIIKSRGHFPSDEAATKLIWLALRNITADWGPRGARTQKFGHPAVDRTCTATTA